MDTIQSRLNIGFPKKQDWMELPAIFTKKSLTIAGHPIMERWETNYMKMLAGVVARNGGDILEVGFGLGIASRFIHKYGRVKSHTIIEFHPDVIKKCKEMYCKGIKAKRIKILKGLWEDVTPRFPGESFDGILFDVYPLSVDQIHKYNFFFFKEGYRLLKKGVVLTYYSSEPKNFSSEHVKKLTEAGFRKINYKTCSVNPPKSCVYWDKKTILAPIIIK